MKDFSHYTFLAEMFKYPSERQKDQYGQWKKIILTYDDKLTGDLDLFIQHIENTAIEYQQEYYVSTFYVQPLCCLDIGYVLFGEDFKRGQFLANLKMEHSKAGNDCGTELPDHLPVIFELLPKLSDSYFAEELVYSLVIPAVNEMISGFRSGDNFYKGLLRIAAEVMEKDFPCSEFERFEFVNRKVRKKDITAEATSPD